MRGLFLRHWLFAAEQHVVVFASQAFVGLVCVSDDLWRIAFLSFLQWARATKATMRITHKPGDAMQVDWAGDPLFITDSVSVTMKVLLLASEDAGITSRTAREWVNVLNVAEEYEKYVKEEKITNGMKCME